MARQRKPVRTNSGKKGGRLAAFKCCMILLALVAVVCIPLGYWRIHRRAQLAAETLSSRRSLNEEPVLDLVESSQVTHGDTGRPETSSREASGGESSFQTEHHNTDATDRRAFDGDLDEAKAGSEDVSGDGGSDSGRTIVDGSGSQRFGSGGGGGGDGDGNNVHSGSSDAKADEDDREDEENSHGKRHVETGIQMPGGGAEGADGDGEKSVESGGADKEESDGEDGENGDESEDGGKKKRRKKKKRKKRQPKKRTGNRPCEVDYLENGDNVQMPDLEGPNPTTPHYVTVEHPPAADSSSSSAASALSLLGRSSNTWAPRFAGHQTWRQRADSFRAGRADWPPEAQVHCGFVQSPPGWPGTGFDISKADQMYLEQCRIAVVSAIFADWDHLRLPQRSKISVAAKRKVCFVMFIDEATVKGLYKDNLIPDANGKVGLWRVVVVAKPPYEDARRTGKIPKLLAHRLFPNAKYSMWIDSKLRLYHDPLVILERFLWRGGHEYAISNHYDRHCVWEEVDRNKKLGKYNATVIDEQFEAYKADGLTMFNPNDPKNLLISNVPEGSVIIRAHTPAANLFSCLWFNEVDRFTSRDQLSFAYTYLKMARTSHPLRLNMFKDCERRSFVKLFHHKAEAEALKLERGRAR
ncbi:hypothetical protein CLOM_g12125 [Closterium sp. NIES-68]|nr:hypothetical protein CLOM_g12125 [Closterium sp. NIES-68]GJP61049.1 hypothetical protein CLOP_g18257 [Closterium sp. NIES-67]